MTALTPSWRDTFCRYGQHVRRHPLRSLVCWLLVLLLLDTAHYVALPPVMHLVHFNPGETSMMHWRRQMVQKDTSRRQWRIHQQWVPLERMSPWLRKAVVAAEDDRFYEHHGFDLQGMLDALHRDWQRKRLSAGGSSISQQLAKNLWFSPERSLRRKLKEAIMTMRLELWLSKDRILELYLNVAEWGRGIFGAEAAALHYFGKPAARLSKREAAQLAVMLPAPLKRTPRSPLVRRLSARLLQRLH